VVSTAKATVSAYWVIGTSRAGDTVGNDRPAAPVTPARVCPAQSKIGPISRERFSS
jgi:hypothetical protein